MAKIGEDIREGIVGPAPHRVEPGPPEPEFVPEPEPVEPAETPVETPDREKVPA